jgi:mannose-6-phosphate isomerase
MDMYPIKFEPIYIEKIWGGRNLERLFDRNLPPEVNIGESWEIADLKEGVSIVSNGPLAGSSISELLNDMGRSLLGNAATYNGRFPLLLKLLDANDILSMQVHPDRMDADRIGGDAAEKSECWYVLESRDGYLYRGLKESTTPGLFRQAINNDNTQEFVRRYECKTGDFHYLPAGTVHALGAGVVVAEIQTPSFTTYRVTDWGRGREVHVERSMECIHFDDPDTEPATNGDMLLDTDYFTVFKRDLEKGGEAEIPGGKCVTLIFLKGQGGVEIAESEPFSAGDTILLPAAMDGAKISASIPSSWLEINLPKSLDG